MPPPAPPPPPSPSLTLNQNLHLALRPRQTEPFAMSLSRVTCTQQAVDGTVAVLDPDSWLARVSDRPHTTAIFTMAEYVLCCLYVCARPLCEARHVVPLPCVQHTLIRSGRPCAARH